MQLENALRTEIEFWRDMIETRPAGTPGRTVEEMFRASNGTMTPEMLNAEIEKQMKLMEERIREEMAAKPAPVTSGGSARIGVSRGSTRTEYTVRD
jgi:hypothetical protein